MFTRISTGRDGMARLQRQREALSRSVLDGVMFAFVRERVCVRVGVFANHSYVYRIGLYVCV